MVLIRTISCDVDKCVKKYVYKCTYIWDSLSSSDAQPSNSFLLSIRNRHELKTALQLQTSRQFHCRCTYSTKNNKKIK